MLISLIAAVAATTPALDCKTAVPPFMESYAAELRAGDRPGLARRYTQPGAYFLGFEAKSFDSTATITGRYAGSEWQKPEAFAWTDLSVEQLGPASCLVTGGFRWTAGTRSMAFAYTAVLRRESDGLRILLEHENPLRTK